MTAGRCFMMLGCLIAVVVCHGFLECFGLFCAFGKISFLIIRRSLLRFNTAPLGAVHSGGAGDLFPRIRKALKNESSIPRCSAAGILYCLLLIVLFGFLFSVFFRTAGILKWITVSAFEVSNHKLINIFNIR